MTELIYHDPSDRHGISPFVNAIREITKNEEVLIACPYITPSFFREITTGTDNWFLLTDVGEWLGIHDQTNREVIQDFIVENHDHVRHVPDLHAKVVVGSNRALIGSANFTTKGLAGRTEMAVLLEEQDVIEEISEWFETLWSIYDQPEIERVEAFIETASTIPTPAQNQSNISFTSSRSPGTASLNESDDEFAKEIEHEESHADLVQRVSKAPSPEWIHSFFKLAGDLLSVTGLSNDDPRLLMSLPQAGTIPITVNNRYTLVAFRGVQSRTEFILPSNMEEADAIVDRADYAGRFDPIYSEAESDAPWFVGFDGLPYQAVDEEFKNMWFRAIKTQMERATASPYKKYHEPVVYRAAHDRDYRERVIREAF